MRFPGVRRRRGQRLSVVIPLFNVERYLAACLDSVLSQPAADLEVVVIDDGSTDGSAALAQQYADKDPRVHLLRQPNGGVSRARNAALEHCTGDLVTFVDPDDIVPPDAWTNLLATLERTGSEFAVGSMERVDARGERRQPPLLRRNHAQERLATTIDDTPLMLADVFPCNKVFRTGFWHAAGLSFPADLRYEDQVLCTEAFLAARSFDVLTDVVYDWYVRDDRTSATQARARLQNLSDRITTKLMTIARVQRHGNPRVTDCLYREVLPIDMWEHFRAAVSRDVEQPDTYWELLREGMAQIWNPDTVPFEQTDLPPGQRLMGWLVEHDRREDLRRLIDQIDGPGVPIEDGRYLHPWVDEPGVPELFTRGRPTPR